MDDFEKIQLMQYLMAEYDRLDYAVKVARHRLFHCNPPVDDRIIYDYFMSEKKLAFFIEINNNICRFIGHFD